MPVNKNTIHATLLALTKARSPPYSGEHQWQGRLGWGHIHTPPRSPSPISLPFFYNHLHILSDEHHVVALEARPEELGDVGITAHVLHHVYLLQGSQHWGRTDQKVLHSLSSEMVGILRLNLNIELVIRRTANQDTGALHHIT
jgi:hypothetical protein